MDVATKQYVTTPSPLVIMRQTWILSDYLTWKHVPNMIALQILMRYNIEKTFWWLKAYFLW